VICVRSALTNWIILLLYFARKAVKLMRDRLIELIKNAEKTFPKDKPVLDIEEFVADRLLANGVIVPPCKVGDVVYKPIITDDTHKPAIWDITIKQISIETGKILNDAYAIGTICKSKSAVSFDFDEIGKTVFLTRGEAEAKLKGGVE
jgi:hypothetical protein